MSDDERLVPATATELAASVAAAERAAEVAATAARLARSRLTVALGAEVHGDPSPAHGALERAFHAGSRAHRPTAGAYHPALGGVAGTFRMARGEESERPAIPDVPPPVILTEEGEESR